MSQRNLVILTRIILFYSLFYIFLKLFIIFRGGWLWPNIILTIPFILLFFLALWLVRSKNFSWLFVVLGAAVIILIRIYESQLAFWLYQQLA
jgi:cellulose synthase/poly-beta-1,6-N-acetylglucosamine synthase-like glycosyltransferase